MYANSVRRSSGNDERPFGLNQLGRATAAIVLAGGRGTRLGALTEHECKPALPFGGFYRNIDFALSNCANSGIYRIGVATQYQDTSLLQHLARVWPFAGEDGKGLVEPWRAELQAGSGSYRGTADAVFQNWSRIDSLRPQLVLILAGDHVYQMDYRPMLMQHRARGADVTVGCVEIPIGSAREFGVMSIAADNRILRFEEKPRYPQCLPARPGLALASMGIYVFNPAFLGRLLREDASSPTSSHDFGHDLLPPLIDKARVFAYPFTSEAVVGAGYWRDVGTITAYWRAHMELLDGVPGLRLDNPHWTIRTNERSPQMPGFGNKRFARPSEIHDSLLAGGCMVDRARVHRSVLFANVSVAAGSKLTNAVVLPDAVIGRHCSLSDIVIGAGARVPDGTVIAPKRFAGGADASGPSLWAAKTASSSELTRAQRTC